MPKQRPIPAADPGDIAAANAMREIEKRLVWLVAFVVHRAVGSAPAAETCADKTLDHYRSKFPPITPESLL